VVVLDEDPLRRLLRDSIGYYNAGRVHTRLADAPNGRPIEARPSSGAKVIGLPLLGAFITEPHRKKQRNRSPAQEVDRHRRARMCFEDRRAIAGVARR